ncbi:MAG: Uma2 family endonuclease [Rhodothermales bacterium]
MLTLDPPTHTIADYKALEEGAPYQLIDGELVMSPPPTYIHQKVVWRLGNRLYAYAETHDLGEVAGSPVDIYLSDAQVYQPDVIIIRKSRTGIIAEENVQGAPDLVVEVLSPATGYYDLTKKRRVYEQAGVREYWLVDPIEHTVTILAEAGGHYHEHQRLEDAGTATSVVLDGFQITLDDLFALN